MFYARFFEVGEDWPFTYTLVDLGWDTGGLSHSESYTFSVSQPFSRVRDKSYPPIRKKSWSTLIRMVGRYVVLLHCT